MPSKRERTRQALLDAAVDALYADPNASLAAVAAAAGVTRVTVHRAFGTRDELLRQLAIACLQQAEEVCVAAVKDQQSPLQALLTMTRVLVPEAARWHFLWSHQAAWSDPEVAREVERQDAELVELVQAAQARGELPEALSARWFVAAMNALILAALESVRAGHLTMPEAQAYAVQTLLAGCQGAANR